MLWKQPFCDQNRIVCLCGKGFGDMENRFIPERAQSFAVHGREWQVLSGGQHHTVALDTKGDFL